MDIYSLNDKKLIDKKNYEKVFKFFIGYNLHLCATPLVIRFPEMIGYRKDFDGTIKRYV